jgi:hypothetical protein
MLSVIEEGNEMKKLTSFLSIFLVILIFSNYVFADDPIEYKLAVIDAGGYVPKDHISVARFRSLLNQLSETYIENSQEIADMSVTAQNLLRKDGINESIRNIMEGLNRLFSVPVENQKYAEYAASYVTLRKKGYSHSEAINGLKAILESMGIY